MSLARRTKSLDDEGHRRFIHPVEVSGRWKRRRQGLHFFLIVFFLAIPWIKIGGRPFLLLNIMERKFSVFGVLFRAHDVPLAFLFAVSFILFFGLLTTLFGRVWCGWGCPQTVFIESVFRRIEGWIEGSALERRKAEGNSIDLEGVLRKSLKWFIFLIVSGVITHSFLAIFVGVNALQEMILLGPSESPQAFLFILLSTALILFDFGWFREQFCIVACPYGRIQSVFQDEQTQTVAYDVKRGEPRGKVSSGGGDCVDCFRCVQVCPTGVDIRDGSSQLECIACTACMDACDDVMTRLKRNTRLIRYAAVSEKPKLVRGRTVLYGVLLFVAVFAIIGITSTRSLTLIEIFKNRGDPFSVINPPSGKLALSNLFIAEIGNHSDLMTEVHFALEDATSDEVALIMPNNPVHLQAGEYLRQPITIQFSKSGLQTGQKKAALKVTSRNSQREEVERKELNLVGPFTAF